MSNVATLQQSLEKSSESLEDLSLTHSLKGVRDLRSEGGILILGLLISNAEFVGGFVPAINHLLSQRRSVPSKVRCCENDSETVEESIHSLVSRSDQIQIGLLGLSDEMLTRIEAQNSTKLNCSISLQKRQIVVDELKTSVAFDRNPGT